MSQILIVLNDKQTSELLRAKLPQKYKVEVILKGSSAEAKSLLEILPDIDILLCSETIGADPVAKKMCEFLSSADMQERKIPVVVIGKATPEYALASLLGENPNINKIIMYLGFLLGFEERNILVEEEAIEREKQERERREKEIELKIQKEEEEKLKIANEMQERVRLEREQAEKERIENEKKEKKRLLEERMKKAEERLGKIEQEKLEKEKLALEQVEKEKALKAKQAQEKTEKEALLQAKLEQEKIEKEKLLAEKAELERLLKEKEARDLIEKEKLENEKQDLLKNQKTQEMRDRIERGKTKILEMAKVKSESLDSDRELLEQEKKQQEILKIEREKQREIESAERLAKSRLKFAEAAKKAQVPSTVEEDESQKTTIFRMPEAKVETKLDTKAPLEKENLSNVDFQAINIKYFLGVVGINLNFNAYTRMKKQNEYEYNLKIQSGTSSSKAEIERMIVRGVKELFVKEADYKSSIQFMHSQFVLRLKNPNSSPILKHQLNSESFEILMEVFKNNTIDKNAIEIIKELIKTMDLLMKMPDKLSLFELAFKEKAMSYGYAHSHLTCLCVFMIIDKFTWSKDQSKNKIIYLAIFHDLTLQNERILKLHHNYNTEKDKLSREEEFIISEHANAAAEILETIVKAPYELTSIIREHHGIKTGIGIPDSLSFSAKPFMMAFILIEEFVTKYLDLKEKSAGDRIRPEQLKSMFDELGKKYNRFTYLDVLTEIKAIFENR